ncbi:MAG: 2,3,4,5-tetrahydropyridine-2,6-dicarboxylate N-succinyltransferase [Pyrinomonadaceae bacterium MAG19_C2-C3]|nr:2,3,4,5-tetrahydropyridine-2,6-dicarboxylate N-succinyltransferase [Pyrinomonadaceae bacterium MAG19_C2-C3]
MSSREPLREQVEALSGRAANEFSDDDRRVFDEFKRQLNRGEVRAAERDEHGTWRANAWVKRGILAGFRMGAVIDLSPSDKAGDKAGFRFFDKDTYPLRATEHDERVRIVPGGTSIRDGAHLASGVVVMPPAYVNVGAFVDENTMIDSHALVGSCAQVGKRVHLSAAAQIGGVLEPVGAVPVIIEDDCLIGGGCGVYEGTIVRQKAILAAGVILTGSTPVYDLVREKVYRREEGKPLEIPSGAVVVPGARSVKSVWGMEHNLSLYAPVIVKYRDARTDAAAQLEDYLR